MIDFRWAPSGDMDLGSLKPIYKLQVRHNFIPTRIASGDIVLRLIENPTWTDVRYVRDSEREE